MNKIVLLWVCILALNSANYSKASSLVIHRFDKDLLSYLNTPSEENKTHLNRSYPTLLPALGQTIINRTDSDILDGLSKYFSHPLLKKIYEDAVDQFEDVSQYERDLETMLNIAQKKLNVTKLPHFSVHVSGFKENTVYVNNTISLSIDKYLGLGYQGYKGYFKGYQLQQMQQKMIVRDFTKAWLIADFIKAEVHGSLVSKMIEEGKLLYTLSVLLPSYTENEIVGYSDAEFRWATENESKLWKTLVDQKKINTTDLRIISLYLNEQTTELPMKNSPVNIGAWIGLQIVKKYANESKQPIDRVLKSTSQDILKGSKYKP